MLRARLDAAVGAPWAMGMMSGAASSPHGPGNDAAPQTPDHLVLAARVARALHLHDLVEFPSVLLLPVHALSTATRTRLLRTASAPPLAALHRASTRCPALTSENSLHAPQRHAHD